MNDLPKYVKKDLEVLYNAEFKENKYGNTWTDYHRLAVKLYAIASKYPDKYLEPVLEYLGYFTDCNEYLDEANYRAEIMHNAEHYFIKAMEDYDMCYDDKVKKQIDFIEMGFIGGWFTSSRQFKDKNYQIQYPTMVEITR